jgi:quercetin dioxygenase-like cupin family protein
LVRQVYSRFEIIQRFSGIYSRSTKEIPMADPLKPLQPKPRIFQLSDLIDYQDGSVVSRQLVKKAAGNVTLFAFDANEGLSEHTAPYDALVQVLEGKTAITISGEPYVLGPGECILMPAGQPHALKAEEPFKMVLTMIRSD